MDRFHLQFILCISLSVCLFQRITSQKVGVPLTVELGGCIANVLSQDVKSYAAIDKTCVCEASVKDYGVIVEWVDNDTGVCLQHAIGTAKLKLAPQHIGSNITCRARHNGVKGVPVQLPPIIYGPNKVKIGMDSSDKLYMNKDCLTHIHFTCEFEKSVFPSATLKALITISSADWTVEDTAKSIAELESDDTKTVYYKYPVQIKGNLTIECVATNSVLERFQSVASTNVQIYESSMKPSIISRPGETLATGNIIVLPARKNGAVSIVCTAPWGNDSQLNLRLRCGGSEKALKDTNEVTLFMDQADMMNDTTCTCKMLLNDCNKSGESVKRILFYVPQVGGGGGGGEETTTIIPSNATAAHKGDEENSSGMYIGIGVGLTLCVVLAAIICFYIGYKAGSKKTMKKMLRNNVNIGKVSFTPNSTVTIQPTPAYEYMPEREPLAEAYTDNVHARHKAAAADDQYSHIDYAYQSDEKDGPYEQPQTKGGKNKKKKKIQLPPRSAHKQNGQQRSDEHFYDQANVYDRSLDQGTNSVYYEAYSKPT